jgi:quinol monooxygenase YgiN
MITQIVITKAKPGKTDELIAVNIDITSRNKNDVGCLLSKPYQNADDSAEIFVIDEFEDEDTFEMHNNSPQALTTREIIRERDLVESMTKIRLIEL